MACWWPSTARSPRSATRPNPIYKAQREAAPDILRQQMGRCARCSTALDITVLDLAGWEADDIIATLAEKAKRGPRRGHRHRRPRQLPAGAATRTCRCSTTTGRSHYALYDEAGIPEKTGVTPTLYPQYAACAATRATTWRACPAWARRPRPSCSHLRQPRRHLRQRGRADPQAEGLAHRARGAGPHNFELMLLRRDAPVDVDFETLGRRAHDARSSACSTSSSSRRCRPAVRSAGRGRHRRRAGRAMSTAERSRPRSPVSTAAEAPPRCARRSRSTRSRPGRASPAAASRRAWPSSPPPSGRSGMAPRRRARDPRCVEALAARPAVRTQRQGADALAARPRRPPARPARSTPPCGPARARAGSRSRRRARPCPGRRAPSAARAPAR